MVKLVVDDEITGGKVAQVQKLDVKPPFYIGGLNPNDYDTILGSLVCKSFFNHLHNYAQIYF